MGYYLFEKVLIIVRLLSQPLSSPVGLKEGLTAVVKEARIDSRLKKKQKMLHQYEDLLRED